MRSREPEMLALEKHAISFTKNGPMYNYWSLSAAVDIYCRSEVVRHDTGQTFILQVKPHWKLKVELLAVLECEFVAVRTCIVAVWCERPMASVRAISILGP